MKNEQIFNKYNSRLVKEGILKSVLCGVTAGFAAVFVISVVSWFTAYNGLWLSVGLGLGISAIVSVICYFVKFRPTAKDIARRVDALGLEERTITMLELENDPSYIAMRQRDDAREHIASANSAAITFSVATWLIVTVVVTTVLSVAVFIASELAFYGIIPPLNEIINPPEEKYFEVTYEVDEGGEIYGETAQLVSPGDDAESVIARPLEGWVFVSWDDGNTNPYRQELAVNDDLIISAIFEQIDNEGDDPENPGGGNGDLDGGDSDDAGDKPGDPGSGAQGGEGDANGGEPSPGDGQGDGGEEGDQPGGDGKGDGAGGKYEENNQIIGNDTYYGDELKNTYDQLMDYLASGGELTPAEKEFIEKYIGSIYGG